MKRRSFIQAIIGIPAAIGIAGVTKPDAAQPQPAQQDRLTPEFFAEFDRQVTAEYSKKRVWRATKASAIFHEPGDEITGFFRT